VDHNWPSDLPTASTADLPGLYPLKPLDRLPRVLALVAASIRPGYYCGWTLWASWKRNQNILVQWPED